MENEELETQESLNPEGDQNTIFENESDDEVSVKLTKAEELARNQKIRAEKAEAELKKLKAQQLKKEEVKEEKKSNEPDYLEKIDKLTLKSEGITHSDDIKMVLIEAKRLQLSVDEVASMDYIKSKLKTAKEQREAESGMPSGNGKPSGGTKNTVEYWKDRKNKDGNYETPSDLELAKEVIDARMKEHQSSKMFSDDI